MAFEQFKLARSVYQTRGIFDKFVYETNDSITEVSAPGYFEQARFPEVSQSIVECACAEGYFIGAVSPDGTFFTLLSSNSVPPQNVVVINSEGDLPNVVGDVSTLAPFTKYIFNEMDTSIRLVMGDGTTLEGSGVFGGIITYTGTGDFITGVNVPFVLQDIAINAPNANQVINASGGGLDTIFMRAVKFSSGTIPINKIGTFDGVGPIFNNFVVPAMRDGVTVTGGPIVGFSAVNCFFVDVDSGSVCWDLTDAQFLDFELVGITMLGTGTCISTDISGAHFVGELEGEVQTCTFGLGTMTPLAGFPDGVNTNQWNFVNNSPLSAIQSTRQIVDYYLLQNNTIPVATSGTFYEIGTPAAGSWQSDIEDRFSTDNTGVITYTGDKPLDIQVIAAVALEKQGGGADQLEGRIAINWTAADPGLQKTRSITDNPTPTSITISALTSISPGDNIRLIFANNDSTSNIIINTCKIDVMGM